LKPPILRRVELRTITWNVFHGRDGPPDPALFTWRSKLLRITERNETHVQVNRDLFREFARVLANARWDVALLQECPPRWAAPLANACDAEAHRVLTSRNWLPRLQGALHRLNPDLTGAWEGGSNLTLVRQRQADSPGRPERRVMALTRLGSGLCIGNLHATTRNQPLAEEELRLAAKRAVGFAGDAALILGGDFNIRPRESAVFDELADRFGLRPPTAPDAIDHLLVRGLEVRDAPHRWSAEEREIPTDGLALRLSDHAPVEALFGDASPAEPG
jgi:endonuclease/exonuclease/phosphatase family metal-dependent hydrolase